MPSTTLRVEFDAKAVQRGLASITKSFAGFTLGAAGKIVQPFTQLAAILAPTALIGSMVAFGKASSEAAASMEGVRAQFEVFTGSKEAVDGLIKSLREIAVKSPLELSDISEGARSLLTYGVETKKVAKLVNQLSEVSAGSAERFGRVTYAFGQISSIGRLMGTELRQLTETGFNPLEFISKKTGESMETLKKRMEDGGISIKEVEQALEAATSKGGRFFGLNDKMSKTFSGQVSMMKDQWSQLLQGFGEGMNNGLKSAITAITTGIPKLIVPFTKFGDYVGKAISDSVNGNYDKFVAIGNLIGASIKVGLETAWQSAGGSIIQTALEQRAKFKDPMGLLAGWGAKKMGDLPSTGELLQANAINAGISQKAAAIGEGTQGIVPGTNNKFRYAAPGESSVFSDGQGNKVIQLLEKVAENTKTGSKM